jgi:tyrosine-specific transport protein
MNQNKVLGGILIIMGMTTSVNMFVLPTIGARVGFVPAFLFQAVVWILTTITGLLVLEVTLNFKENANGFSSMAEKTLGKAGKAIVWLCFLPLFYAYMASYILSAASLPGIKIFSVQLPAWSNAILLTLIVGRIIFGGIGVVDLCNRGLITIKGLCLLAVLVFLMPQVNLKPVNFAGNLYSAAFPLLFVLFGVFRFNIIVPSLCNYIGHKPLELKRCIIIGTTGALIISLLLMVAGYTENVAGATNNKWFVLGFSGFFNIASTTSFLLVSLGVFDFLADGFKFQSSKGGRLQTIILTFVPPLALGLFYPQGLIYILKYAAFFAAILLVILPALMAYRMRMKATTALPYQVFGGNLLLVVVIAVGVFLAALQLYTRF